MCVEVIDHALKIVHAYLNDAFAMIWLNGLNKDAAFPKADVIFIKHFHPPLILYYGL